MKKIYILSFFSLTASLCLAQANVSGPQKMKRSDVQIEKRAKTDVNDQNKVTIWESDFSTPSEWVADHDAADCSLDFQIGSISCQGFYPINDIASTSAMNGWAILDSDFYGGENGGNEVEDSWLTMAVPVDLTSYPNVVVEFETFYRAYTYEKPYLVVGIGDGAGNVTWPTDLNPESDLALYPNVFDVFPERTFDEQTSGTENPRLVRINISAIAGGQQEVYIRFNWTGTWGYAWFIDDFRIIEQPQDDLESKFAFFAGVNNEGIEYGRTPVDQLDTQYDLGGEILNFGINDQTNVSVAADFGSFNYTYPVGTMLSGATATYGSTESPSLALGMYTGTYTVTSDNEQSGAPDFGNNVSNRNFEVTEAMYSQDGIGIHPSGDLSLNSLGSPNFGEPTETYLAAMYHLKNTVNVISGFEIGLASSTVEGAELLISIVDTVTFLSNGLQPVIDLNSNSAEGIYYSVSASEIAAGKVGISFLQPIELPAGAYYAVVKTIDYGGTPIRVLDDQTIAQPWYASMINSLDDTGTPTAYSNGNAFAIRLKMGDQMGIAEDVSDLFTIYPNPAQETIEVLFSQNIGKSTLTITDIAGKTVYSNVELTGEKIQLEVGQLQNGIYFVNLINDNKSTSKRLVINN
ncbi:MAG: T9SS type A sorting domain-containing protein [Bacteroidetes bacterium]|nr:MAG: T9SS type A sorting domain-containing protein [Bacteroidota bacterium]